MGLDNLFDMALGENYAALTDVVSTPVSTFICPTRRTASLLYPYTETPTMNQLLTRPQNTGRTDYAANGGDGPTAGINYQVGWTTTTAPACYTYADTANEVVMVKSWYGSNHPTGVVNLYSQCKLADITDGVSNTFLLARNLNPDSYYNGGDSGDDQGWCPGYDYDVDRWVETAWHGQELPRQDTPGWSEDLSSNFGSAHANSLNMAFCDGSVQSINYSIEFETWRCLGNREDGLAVDPDKLW